MKALGIILQSIIKVIKYTKLLNYKYYDWLNL